MAQDDLFNLIHGGRYTYLMDPTSAFVFWFTSSDSGMSYQNTTFAVDRRRGEVEAPECLMDYLFIWLAEGEALEFCPTYEDWLLTIISIADQLRRGRFGARWTQPLPDGSEPEYLHPDDQDLDEIRIEDAEFLADSGRTIDMPLLAAPIDLTHPALSKVMFDRVKVRRERDLLRPPM